MFWAPSLGEVRQWIHQQVGAKRRSLQMGLEVLGTQRHFTPQAGLDSQTRQTFLRFSRAAVTQNFPSLLLTLGADEATSAVDRGAPGLADAGRAEAVTTRQGVGSAEGVSAHRAGQLILQGRHCEQMKADS